MQLADQTSLLWHKTQLRGRTTPSSPALRHRSRAGSKKIQPVIFQMAGVTLQRSKDATNFLWLMDQAVSVDTPRDPRQGPSSSSARPAVSQDGRAPLPDRCILGENSLCVGNGGVQLYFTICVLPR